MASNVEKLYYASPVWLQNLMVTAMGYRLFRKRYTGPFDTLYQQVLQSREWTDAERLAWQNERLHQMIRHCRQHVPYYTKLFADHGLHENDFTHVNDLTKLPILDKQTVRQHDLSLRSRIEKPYMIQHTSGSTGTPLALAVNETTYKLAMALLLEHEQYHGIPFRAPRATFAGRMTQKPDNTKPPFSRFNKAENQRLYSSYHLNTKTFPFYREDLDRFQPQELIGYPSAISDLASHYERSGTQPQFKPKAIITNSETLLAWQREKIEAVFRCPVFDYYGTAEYIVFAGQDRSGVYRINPLLGITEILTEDNGTASGDVISTTLTNSCMPLLRYRTGDTALAIKNFGYQDSPSTSLSEIYGRKDDYIETPDGRCIGRMDHIFKGVSGLIEAQITQDLDNHCTIHVVFSSSPTSKQLNLLLDNFKYRTGHSLQVSINITNAIPRNINGKFQSVINNHKKQRNQK